MRTLTPLSDRVLVKPDAVPVKTTGLAAPPSQKEVPTEGIVVAVGPGADAERTDKRGRPKEYNPDGVQTGQRVQYAKYAGRDVMHNGSLHKLLRLEEIEGLIEETAE
jgi:chaperonin GroES